MFVGHEPMYVEPRTPSDIDSVGGHTIGAGVVGGRVVGVTVVGGRVEGAVVPTTERCQSEIDKLYNPRPLLLKDTVAIVTPL